MGRTPKDLTGQRFGKLTAIELVEHLGQHKSCKWLCKCDCGNERIVRSDVLQHGGIKNCGCVKKARLVGQRFGKLVVLEAAYTKKRHMMWKCKCDCGNITYVETGNLSSGRTRSCGCYQSETMKTHGLSGTRLDVCYTAMKQRCFNPNNKQYCYYGGRGITICDEWLGENGFINFYNWAMANGYNDSLTIDRIDVNGNYEPSNCRWVTHLEQMNNTTRNHYIEIDGEKHTVTQWCRIKGITPYVFYNRVKHGYSEQDAITTPLFKNVVTQI